MEGLDVPVQIVNDSLPGSERDLPANVELLDDDNDPVARGDVGEICVRSPAVMTEYWSA